MNEAKAKMSLKKIFFNYNYIFIFVIMFIICIFVSGSFLSYTNISNLLRQNSGLLIAAMGMLLVVLTGGIDLSVSYISTVSGVLSAIFFTNMNMPLPAALILALLVCTGIGAINGLLIAYTKMAPFIATLAIQTVAKGIALVVTNGSPVTVPTDRVNLSDFGSGYFLGLPNPFWLSILAIVIFAFLLRKMKYGRIVRAIGSNEAAVRLSGISTRKYLFSVYALSGFCAGVAGIITLCRTGIGSPLSGVGLELDAISGIVIGGASLNGGKGSVLGAVLGVFIFAFITNIMNLLGVASYPQEIIKGVIIVAAVLLQMFEGKAGD